MLQPRPPRNMVTDAMLKSMGGNCINIGVVLERYADFCDNYDAMQTLA
jgi:hypothetical protein